MPDATAEPEARVAHELEERVCPLCHSTRWSHEYVPARFDASRFDEMSFSSRKDPQGMHYRYLECTACSVLYASPVPSADALVAAYREAGYESQLEAQHAADTYAEILRRYLPSLPDRGRAVDIGAGDGAFLQRLIQAGFEDVIGFEPSNAPRAAADPDVVGYIRPEPFVPGSLADGSASFVSCLQTIEHVPDPLGLCLDASRVLGPGGVLLIVGHDRRALTARILRERSPIYDVEHLQLFSKSSLRTLLERAGFERIEVTRLANRYPLEYWLRLAPLPSRLRHALDRVIGRSRLGRVPVKLFPGNLVATGYRAAQSSRAT